MRRKEQLRIVPSFHSLAGLVLAQRTAVGADDKRIVAALDVAIGNLHVAGAVHVKAVVVGVAHVAADRHAADGDIVAVVDPDAPSGGTVFKSEAFKADVAATGKEDDARQRLFHREDALELPSRPIGIGLTPDMGCAVAVDGAFACDGDVLALVGEDETGAAAAREIGGVDVARRGPVWEVGNVGRCEEARPLGDVQLHAGAELDGAGEESAAVKDDADVRGWCPRTSAC